MQAGQALAGFEKWVVPAFNTVGNGISCCSSPAGEKARSVPPERGWTEKILFSTHEVFRWNTAQHPVRKSLLGCMYH
jgi:hypothetical protein